MRSGPTPADVADVDRTVEVDAALTALARDHSGRVLAILASRFSSVDLADDAVQDALIRAGERWPIDGIPSNPAGWLMTVARNKVIDHWRRVEREDKLIEKMKGECPVFVTDDQPEQLSDVAVTLGRLQPRYSSILVRHYMHGESVGAMAADDGVSYSAMESAMARARSAFRSSHDAA